MESTVAGSTSEEARRRTPGIASRAIRWLTSRSWGSAVEWGREWKPLAIMVAVFLAAYFLPIGSGRFDAAVTESLALVKWYAREHVLLCLIPAFFIAGAISVFVNQQAVLRYLGPKANRWMAYGVGSVSGTILAVCSCTVLPLFAGIYMTGAGLGPATAFLYSGPAINVLAIILTARVLGWQIGLARAVGAVLFAVVVGLLMHRLFRREETERAAALTHEAEAGRPLWQNVIYFGLLVAILVFANWGRPDTTGGFWYAVYAAKWPITAAAAAALGAVLVRWFGLSVARLAFVAVPTVVLALGFPEQPLIPFGAAVVAFSIVTSTAEGELGDWFASSWGFAKQIFPLLFAGIVVAGLLLGRPGHEGLIPAEWVVDSVGGNSLAANLLASVSGAFMYFATLTEVPILQGLLGSGMGQGPALALLLAGPAVSLPSLLVIRSILGWKKTAAYALLVMVMATVSGVLYGILVGG